MKKLLCVLLTALLIIPCLAAPAPEEVSIVFTHDMHSHFEEQNGRGGFAKLKTAIDSVRDVYSETLVLDAGDFAMGTPFQTIYSTYAPELRLMGMLGYHATTLGNHEFDYRTEGLRDMLQAAQASGDETPAIVASNIDWDATIALHSDGLGGELQQSFYATRGSEGLWLESGGQSVFVFGLMGYQADSYAPESGVIFSDPIETAQRLVAENRAQADMIICLSHSGTSSNPKESEDENLARAVPDIDLIISGHSHTVLAEPLVVGNTTIASAGEYTDNLGRILMRKGADGWYAAEYALLPLDQNIADDPEIFAYVNELRDVVSYDYFIRYGYEYEQILAYNPYNFTPIGEFSKEQGEDTLGNLISDSYDFAIRNAEDADYTKVDVAIVPSGVVRASFAEGYITVADAFNVSSLGIGPDRVPGYPLVSVWLTGEELWTAAEVDATVSELMGEARLYMSGMNYTFNPHRLFLNRVVDVNIIADDGSMSPVIDKDKLYRVVGDLYSCQMLGAVKDKSFGLLSLTPKDANGVPITDFEAHIIGDGAGGELKAWYALASYIDSFEDDTVPFYYSTTHGRKNILDSTHFLDLISRPNKIFFMLLGVILFLIALCALCVLLIVRRKRKRR